MITMTPHTGCQCPACAQEDRKPPVVHHDDCPPCADFRHRALAAMAD